MVAFNLTWEVKFCILGSEQLQRRCLVWLFADSRTSCEEHHWSLKKKISFYNSPHWISCHYLTTYLRKLSYLSHKSFSAVFGLVSKFTFRFSSHNKEWTGRKIISSVRVRTYEDLQIRTSLPWQECVCYCLQGTNPESCPCLNKDNNLLKQNSSCFTNRLCVQHRLFAFSILIFLPKY